MRELAVDFGTSNTVAAARMPGTVASRLLTFDGWPVLPSAVWLADDGGLVVGREAERQARLDPARYEPNPKHRIDDGQVLLGRTTVDVADLIAAVLGRVAVEAERQLGGPPDVVVLTHPAGWHRARRAVLLAAAARAGWPHTVRLVAEPVAAAAHFTNTGRAAAVRPGQAIAVYDLGGGTTDVAVLTRGSVGWRLLAEAGVPDFGGRDIDHLLLEHVRATVSSRHAESTGPLWADLLRPATPAGRRASRALGDDIRAGKEALSAYPQTDIPLPPPLPDVHVTRRELEDLVRPALERSVTLLADTVAEADLRAVFLVGGATRMPLVARLIHERLGVLPVAVDSPECGVVLGAGGAASAEHGSAEPHRGAPSPPAAWPGHGTPVRDAAATGPGTTTPPDATGYLPDYDGAAGYGAAGYGAPGTGGALPGHGAADGHRTPGYGARPGYDGAAERVTSTAHEGAAGHDRTTEFGVPAGRPAGGHDADAPGAPDGYGAPAAFGHGTPGRRPGYETPAGHGAVGGPAGQRPRWPFAVAAAAIVVAAAATVAIALAGTGDSPAAQPGTASTAPAPGSPGGSGTPASNPSPRPSSNPPSTRADPGHANRAAFGSDTELLDFAGPALANAKSCVNTMGTNGVGDMVSARTHVRCEYDGTDGATYFANYLSGDDLAPCRGYVGILHSQPGSQWSDPFPWPGGSVFEITATGPSATIYWQYNAGTPCGYFGPREEAQVSVLDLHEQWNASAGLGS